MSYLYCSGCNTHYVDTGCGQDREHAGCPHRCSLCGLLLDGRDTNLSCPGHTFLEVRRFDAQVRGRDRHCPNPEPHGEHEWYGEPATLRRDCPGVPDVGRARAS